MKLEEAKKLKKGDKIVINLDYVMKNNPMFLDLELDFEKVHTITEIVTTSDNAIVIGVEGYTRHDAESSILERNEGVFDSFAEEVVNLLGRENYGNVFFCYHEYLEKYDVINEPVVQPKEKFNVGDEMYYKCQSFEDVMIGADIYSEFGVDVFDGEKRKITEIYRLYDGCFETYYLLALEGVHRLEPRQFEDFVLDDIKKRGIDKSEYGDCFILPSSRMKK